MTAATKSSRKERERLGHRQEILSVALRLFAAQGFHQVSMQEIAAAAEFATGTLYRFFPSKEDLFFELLVAAAEESLGLVLPALEGPDDEREKLARFIRLHERIVREQATTLRLFLLESRGRYLPGPRVAAKREEFNARVLGRLAEVIAAGVRRRRFHKVDPMIAARSLKATLEVVVLAAVDAPQAADLRADLKKVETIFFRGLVKT
jgi:AcrR family transcriptional regulator